jgi:hypothetical protein
MTKKVIESLGKQRDKLYEENCYLEQIKNEVIKARLNYYGLNWLQKMFIPKFFKDLINIV